jgi:PAS domain S-box-containing protein
MTVERLPADALALNALVRAAVDSFTSYALIIVDAQGAILSWSVGAERAFGYPCGRVEGQSLAILLSPELKGGSAVVSWIENAASQIGLHKRSFRHLNGSVRVLRTSVRALCSHSQPPGFALLVANEAMEDTCGDDARPPSLSQSSADAPAARLRESTALLETEIAGHTEGDARLRLLQRLIVAQEEERVRIAQNLHDDLGQQLTALRLTLGTVRSSVDTQPTLARSADSALAILTNIDDALDFLTWELRPAALEELGLTKVLEGYVAEWSRHSSIEARFHSGLTDADRFGPEVEATVYRIAQEALNNVAKHSQAHTVNVILEPRHERIVLVVEDDGVGCVAADVSDRTMGMSGMQERAAAVGGTLELEPTPRGGTTVLASIPMVNTRRLAALAASPSQPQSDAGITSGTPTDAVLVALRERLFELQNAVGARDEFIATVAHELRNPISPLVFQVRLALDKIERMASSGEAPKVEWMQSQLRRMEQRLHRLLETLDRLLDVSRLSTGRIDLQLERLDLTQVAQEVLSSFEAELAVARCRVSFSTGGETTGSWDRMRLEQICRNLVSNAIRFGAGQPVAISVNGDAAMVTLTVRDRGVGIATGEHGRIFERFERGVEQRSGGFGIGLWVVKNICMAMGGEIGVESTLGAGACFTVSLPRRMGQPSAPAVQERG